ncbi:permease [Dankookia sp. GCM10030260]|uniref:permease n=1 Tax=Dankookia sp. GCM10030260 TaxID=3273390 RepID=UPI00361B21D5
MPRFLRRHSSLLVILSIGLVSGSLVWVLHGPEAFRRALGVAFDVFLTVLPALLAGLLLAGSLKQLVPPGALAKWMGAESGTRGLLVATLCGMAMPGGPMAAFPLVLVLAQAGADRGALIAFIVAWALNGFQRVLVWEVPLLGADFALLRFLCGLPLSVVAGAVARRIPIAWVPPGTSSGTRA